MSLWRGASCRQSSTKSETWMQMKNICRASESRSKFTAYIILTVLAGSLETFLESAASINIPQGLLQIPDSRIRDGLVPDETLVGGSTCHSSGMSSCSSDQAWSVDNQICTIQY